MLPAVPGEERGRGGGVVDATLLLRWPLGNTLVAELMEYAACCSNVHPHTCTCKPCLLPAFEVNLRQKQSMAPALADSVTSASRR